MKILIVDDEQPGREIIKNLLIARHSGDFAEIKTAESADEASDLIAEFDPDLLFLDVSMHPKSGFDLLEELAKFRFEVIFVSAHNHAIGAFRVNALDYLLKPIDVNAFDNAFTKAVTHVKQKNLPSQSLGANDKIGLTTRDGFIIINLQDIIRCEADGNYTVFVLEKNQRIIVSRSLKEAGKILERFPAFLRVQRSFIVNTNKIVRYSKSEGGYVILSDNFQVTVSAESKTMIEGLFNVL
jgi:two-component system LytT family response regulator